MRAARHIKLEAGHPDGLIRFLSGLPALSLDGERPTSWVTLTRTGTFSDPRYGEFEISRHMLSQMVENFKNNTVGQDIMIDVAHMPTNGSAGKIVELAVEGSKLRARVEWTPYGVDAIRSKGYQYLSAEYHENWQDNEQKAKHGPTLLGAGLTIRPVIKHLDPVQLSEPNTGETPTLAHPELQTKLLQELHMKWAELIKALLAKLQGLKLAEPVITALIGAAEKAVGNVTEEAIAKQLMASFEESGKKLAEQIGDKVIKLDISVPEMKAGLSAEDVKKLMQEETARQAEAAKKLAETLGTKVKLLSDTIGAAQGLSDEMKKELTDAVKDLVTAEMSDDHVKRLAATQISSGNRLTAAEKLASMGFVVPRGTVHITVDDSNTVKSLQESIDKRLGFADMPEARRYIATGGKLPLENKQLAEKILAQYDAEHAVQLRAEHKQLAAGDGKVSDVAIPAIFERTVIREAMYQLVGLQFVNMGTLPFSASAIIPYSYRDATAASRASTRVYEGGAIPRAGVIQTSDTAYPLPQKLAFEVSDELRYLTSNGQLDWDAVVENVRNASRIIGGDTEKLIFDEQLNACDQYSTAAVVNEAVANGDAAKTIFCLNNFPVVRPKIIRDLQGTQIGQTAYPVTVKSNNVTITEWDGTGTQQAGLYYWMDYNLGEIHFVDEAGAGSAPAGGHAIVCSYTYTTNVYAFDTDLGPDEIDAHWDTFLYRYGLRKAVIEDQRYHACNFGLMSGTVRTQIEQAKQFAANFARAGTDLMADGNLGRIKDVPNYKTSAPGLNMADARVVIGERALTRFRMMKPWAMGQLQDQKDSNGRFTGKKEAYGDQFIVLHTPIPLKAGLTSIVLYSATARVDR